MFKTPFVREFTKRLNAPVYALPLDLCRIVTGVVILAYFARTFVEAEDFSDLNGLIDHGLSNELFPFTRVTLFNSSLDLFAFETIFLLAVLGSVGLILGYRPKLCAAFLYIVAVSTYRWNFLVIYVDDAIVHLMLFWMLLLPIGRTVTIGAWLTNRRDSWPRWRSVTVPGAPVRCFLANIALLYLVAGLWKWTSPMWREGTAVYAILQTPLAFAPDWWKTQHLWVLIPLNYLALICEPLFPLICIIRARHPLKYVLLVALTLFHAFILATLRLPFANVACLGAGLVLAQDELMLLVHRSNTLDHPPAPTQSTGAGVFAFSFVTVLTLAMVSSVTLPDWRKPLDAGAQRHTTELQVEGLGHYQRVFFSALWSVGIAQQYQLLNWIDQRNFKLQYTVTEIGGDGKQRLVGSVLMFPINTRSLLLQSYMNGMVWNEIPSSQKSQLRESLNTRFAARYCRRFQPVGKIAVDARVQRTGFKQQGLFEASPSFQMTFTCQTGRPVFEQ